MARIFNIKPRKGTASQWAAAHSAGRVIDSGELAVIDNDFVIGDGSTAPASLPKVGSGTYAPLNPSGAEALNVVSGVMLRPFDGQLAAGGSRVYLFGHSVIHGNGASTGSKACSSLIASGIIAADPTATVSWNGYAGLNSTEILAQYASAGVNPVYTSLSIFMGLANDYEDGLDPAVSKANVQALVAKMKAIQPVGSPTPGMLILAEWRRSDITTPAYPWSSYVTAAREVANADPSVGFLDIGARMGDVSGDLNGFYADAVHPNNKGHAFIARTVLNEILTRAPVARRSLLASLVWNPATKQVLTTTAVSGSEADIDAARAVVTFVAPASGNVRVHASAQTQVSAGAAYWCLKSNSTVVSGSRRIITQSNAYLPMPYDVLITGLTPNTSYTWKLAHYVNAGTNTSSFVAGGTTDGPLVVDVIDAGTTVTSITTP